MFVIIRHRLTRPIFASTLFSPSHFNFKSHALRNVCLLENGMKFPMLVCITENDVADIMGTCLYALASQFRFADPR